MVHRPRERLSGQPGAVHAMGPRLADTNVAVYVRLDGAERCMPCDSWPLHAELGGALGLTVAAPAP